MKRLIPFILLIALLSTALVASASGTIPTFSIVSVEAGESVTIKTSNFPASDTFEVRMGKMGTRGVGGELVTTQDSGAGGSFTATYALPASLKDDARIAIRLESPTSGYYAFNWFYNNTAPAAPPATGTIVIPTFTIESVEKDDTVTIDAANFPEDETFTVRMGYMGTRGVNGIVVGTQESGTGAFSATYDIPDEMKGQYQIAIRLESTTSGYYSYNWFYNNTAPAAPPPPAPAFVIPTFTIESVVKDGSVTIKTANFPADETFTVRMGYMGTRGINGTVVGTQDSGDGGTFTATYDIPDALKGQYRIAIRLESASGYYSYNWFYNNDAP